MMTKFMSTTDAARVLGVNRSRVRQLILAGRLPATKIGRDWMIDERDVDAFDQARKEKTT